MRPVEPIIAAPLFPGLHAELIALLEGLAPEQWNAPTIAAGWSVKDMAAHLLDTGLRRLASQRDGHPSVPPPRQIASYRDLVDFLDQLNAEWVRAFRRVSPRALTEMLASIGPQLADLFASLDPFAPARVGVAWAGETHSLNWFDIAREYTEQWMHQQQIRDAVGAPALTSRHWLHPVLDTFVRGLPHTFRDLEAPAGSAVTLRIDGKAGNTWTLVREAAEWRLYAGQPDTPAALVALDQDTAWRLFTKGLAPADALSRASIAGDTRLGRRVFDLIAIMA
jgi:uncharacterized protein (TIGR03083 family)